MALNNPMRIETPTIRHWAGGLLAVATVLPMPDEHMRNGIYFRAPDCGVVNQFTDLCSTNGSTPGVTPKTATFPNPGTVAGVGPWDLYSYLNCRETTLEAMLPAAEASLALGRQKAIELAFWHDALAVPASVVLNVSSLPVDALTVAGGIAALEQYMSYHYAGQATFHAERGLSPYVAFLNEYNVRSGVPETVLGSQWAFYGGSPNTSPGGVAAPVGYSWMYATSQVQLWYSSVDVYPGVDQMIQYGPTLSTGPTNVPTAIAEQTWVGAVFCTQAAVLVYVDANVPLTEA